MSTRERFEPSLLDGALSRIRCTAKERLREKGEKGDGIFVSAHESLGVIAEEYHELVEAVRDRRGIEDELLDLAVACYLALACRCQQDW